MGEKLKVQELEVGKVYILYNNNDQYYRAIFIINKQGDLLEGTRYRKNENFFKKSSVSYNKVKNGYFKEIKREIDWSKVDSGTKVQVRNNEDSEWENRYFVFANEHDTIIEFIVSKYFQDAFMGHEIEEKFESYKYCRIHPSETIPYEWYKRIE